jgi:hypothetical protein
MLEQHLHTSPNLRLDVISSASLQKGQIITINPLGLYGNQISERERDQPGSGQDGFTYFGSVAHALSNYNGDGNVFND